ncbi:phage protease [Shinella sp. JR1-6]|uniref:phage protease n=1 Tax=Shinella sp. JR1-6 TaxID=2527671 RepID=UPI00102D5C5C|nr:phage protease [Shinella sp. JR1-6]TAA61626.1 hypothetical protein EXZ48_10775 [Shinella sp. JR1-6]
MVALVIWGNLLPKGPDLTARDDRRWTYNPAEVVAAFVANQGPLAVDYEHGQDLLKGEAAPAAGWIVAMEDRDGALWGKIEWTERASAMIREREYRFLSSSMRLANGGRIIGLDGAALVNRPALPVAALDPDQTGETEREARALASKAQVYQTEQATLGRAITISEAVTTVAAMSAGRAAF